MKHLQILGLVGLVAMVLTAFAAGTASATTLEVGGATQNQSVTFRWSLAAVILIWGRTDGSLGNECTQANVEGDTETFTGSTVTGAVDSMSFTSCTRPITVHKRGTLHVSHISGTTNGTVSSSGAEITVGSPFGTLNCKTGEGVDLGTLTGTASGSAEIDVKAVLNCGFLAPSFLLIAIFVNTSPSGTGVSP